MCIAISIVDCVLWDWLWLTSRAAHNHITCSRHKVLTTYVHTLHFTTCKKVSKVSHMPEFLEDRKRSQHSWSYWVLPSQFSEFIFCFCAVYISSIFAIHAGAELHVWVGALSSNISEAWWIMLIFLIFMVRLIHSIHDENHYKFEMREPSTKKRFENSFIINNIYIYIYNILII